MRTASEGAAELRLRALLESGEVGGLPDGRLLERFVTGDGPTADAAFAALVDRHGPMVWRACRAILADPNDADDAFQATFLVMVRRSRSLWARESLGPWLLQVARRTSMRARSLAQRRRFREFAAAGLKPRLAVEPPPDELGAAIHEEVGRLPERYREVVVLCLLEGLPDSQAATRLGWPLGTVHSRLARGREKLRRGLTRRGLAPAVAALASSRTPTEAASAAVPARLIEATARSASRLASLGLRDAALPAAVAALTEGVLRMTWLAKIQAAALSLAAIGCVAVAAAVGPPGVEQAPEIAPKVAPPAPPEAAPPPKSEAVPKEAPADPVNSVVQILVGEGTHAQPRGLGTIISSTQAGSIILTSSGILPRVRTDGSATPILVEPHEQGKPDAAEARPESRRFPAEVVAWDAPRELVLLRIHPGRVLGRARVVPPRWKPQVQMRVGIATRPRRSGPPFGASKILKVVEDGADVAANRSIICAGPPEAEALGGGLFTGDMTQIGDVAGVCQGPVPDAPGVNAYAPPAAIYAILDANGLAHLYRDPQDAPTTAEAPPTESPAPASSVVEVVVRSASRPDLPVRSLGTVIASTPEASFVLTSFNGVEIVADPAGGKSQVRGEIRVGGLAGESVDVEPTSRLALLRFRPGRLFPTARVLPRNRPLGIGQDMELVDGFDPARRSPSTRPARILELSGSEPPEAGQAGPPGVLALLCDASPPGVDSSGAGLFLKALDAVPPLGDLAGVFQLILPERQRGMFIGPEAIHRLLDRNGLGRHAGPTTATLSPSVPPPPSPKIDEATTAAMLASTVSVFAFDGNESGPRNQAAGTVISSTPDRSIVLTSAHIVLGRAADAPGGRKKVMETIRVVLDTKDSPQGAFAAEAIQVDEDRDLAALRIRPGAIIPTARVAPPSRRLVVGAPASRLDRPDPDRDRRLEVKPTTIVALDYKITNRASSWTSCTGAPKGGLSGSGLFVADSVAGGASPILVGLCNYADPATDRGFYASPDMIYAALDAAGLSALYQDEASNAPPPEVAGSEIVKRGFVALAVEGAATPIALGTVIFSTEEESIALTAGSIFAGPGDAPADPKRFGRKVMVYYPRPRTEDSVPIPPIWGTAGEVVDFDVARNVGLVRFRPGRKLRALGIVPTSWKPTRGASVIRFLNLSATEAPAAIREPSVVDKFGDVDYEAIECGGSPARTNVGAPLIVMASDDKSSAIAGVCNYSSPQDAAGYYAAPAMIYHILDANGLSDLYRKGNEAFGLAPPLPFKPDRRAPASPQPERTDHIERRVDEIDRKLDRILESLERPTPR